MVSPKVVEIILPAPKRSGSSKAGAVTSTSPGRCEAQRAAELLPCAEEFKLRVAGVLVWC